MGANISNFQKYIIRNIVKSVEYDALLDSYTFNRCEISDDLISIIVQEGKRYGMSEQEVRQFIALTASNIKPQPTTDKFVTNFDISKVTFGAHIRIEINHPIKGLQWVECIKLKQSLFVLSSSISGILFGTRITPQTKFWAIGCFVDFSFQLANESLPIKSLILRLGEIKAIELYSPSIVHEILDSSKAFTIDEEKEAKKQTKKLTITQRETELLSLIDTISESVEKQNIKSDYLTLKSLFVELNLSSYLLNILIANIKNYSTAPKINSELFDEHFFVYKQMDNSQIDDLNEKLQLTNSNLIKITKKWNKKEGWFIATIVFLFSISIFLFFVYCIVYNELEEKYCTLEQENKNYKTQCDSLNNDLNVIHSYSFVVGSSIRYNKGCDGNWIMWLNAKHDVYLESCYLRGQENGKVIIGIYDAKDNLIKSVNAIADSTFSKVDMNVELPQGNYYLKRKSGVELQYHSSNSNEYAQYNNGALIITGCCHYDNRHNNKEDKNYYQYFYNITYHLK
ncbi:MAG: hypothetical protein IKO26_06610 [Paludibacteraceae bacterium]|nr:hypothetical protein [Paludibacteraceae bacterium]